MRSTVSESDFGRPRGRAIRLASTLSRTAEALETSAGLADQHARRIEGAGRPENAAAERQAAARSRDAARRARARADEWLNRTQGRP